MSDVEQQVSPMEVEVDRISGELQGLIQQTRAAGFPSGDLEEAMRYLEMADIGLSRHRRRHRP